MAKTEREEAQASLPGFLLRLAAALLLVMLTYNPTRFCFVAWVRAAMTQEGVGAVHALSGIALLIGWTVFLRTAWGALGTLGIVLGTAFLAAVVWVLIDYDVLAVESGSALAWVVLTCVATLLAVGMSWGLWKRRASGQVEVDEIND